MFCSLHILHNFRIYAQKSLVDWKIIFEEEGVTRGVFKNSSNCTTFDFIQ